MCTVRFTNTDSIGRGGGAEGLCMCPVGNTAQFNPFGHPLLVIYEGKFKVVPIHVAVRF